jgi:hypothetical protein
MELEVEWAASRPALDVRVGRVEYPPFSEPLRAPTGARSVLKANRCPSSSSLPRSTREARALPREIIWMNTAFTSIANASLQAAVETIQFTEGEPEKIPVSVSLRTFFWNSRRTNPPRFPSRKVRSYSSQRSALNRTTKDAVELPVTE